MMFVHIFGRMENENLRFPRVEYDTVVRFWKIILLHVETK